MNPPPLSVTEAAFQKTIIETAQLYGWLVMHVSDSRREVIDRRRGVSMLVGDELARGWPDLALAHPRRGVFALRELKTEKGRLAPAQQRWLEALAVCGVDVDVWRPRHWDELIVPFLRGKTRQRTEAA